MADSKKIAIKPAVKIAAKPVKLKNKPARFFDKISLRPSIKLHDVREPDLPAEQS
jgi:hypothetical protein